MAGGSLVPAFSLLWLCYQFGGTLVKNKMISVKYGWPYLCYAGVFRVWSKSTLRSFPPKKPYC